MPKAEEGENEANLPPFGQLDRSALFDVKDKAVLVTGGGSGIGAMIAATFVANGANVIICSRKNPVQYAEFLSKKGPGTCSSLAVDITKEEDIAALMSFLQSRPRSPSGRFLDVLINNSGTNFAGPIDQYPRKQFSKVLDLNVTAIFRLTQALLPMLQRPTSGYSVGEDEDPSRVINIASINGVTIPDMETYAYSTSKAAVTHLTKHMAARLAADGILVNAVCPGAFPSRMMRATLATARDAVVESTALKRTGTPQDIGGACMFMCSRAGAWITGATLVVDGGQIIRSPALESQAGSLAKL